MKARIRHIFEIIAGAILSLLGFSACNGVNIIDQRVEYGMPHATFEIKGTVTESAGVPVSGIKVKFRQHVEGMEDENGKPRYTEVELSSDQEGKVETSFVEWPDVSDIEFTFEDVDGEENGGYFAPDTLRSKDIKVTLEEDKESNWNKGTYKISFQEKLTRIITEQIE